MLHDSVKRWVDDNFDFAARSRRVADTTACDEVIWLRMAELGWLGIALPEDCGGSGLGAIETMLVAQGLGRGLLVEPYVASAVLGGHLLSAAGSPAQRRQLLPSLSDGTARVALAWAEPRGRYDAAHVATRAVAEGDGWRIDGDKCVVLGAPGARELIVSARTSHEARDPHGISLFLLPAATAGLSRRDYRSIDGHAAAEVSLRGVRAGPENLLGAPGAAFGAIELALDHGAAALAADAVGAMERAVELTAQHMKMRQQFGQPLSGFQVLQHSLVDMYIALEETRSLALWAARSLDGHDATERRRAVSAAKAHAGEAGRLVGQSAVQIHGGMGIIEEVAIGHYLKRLTAIDRLFGDRMFHLDRYADLESLSPDAP